MLRVHCAQLFHNLSDPGMEDMLCEAEPARRFAGLKLETLPDETTILKFRHLLEKHRLGKEKRAWGDAGYQVVEKRPENRGRGAEWRVAMLPGRGGSWTPAARRRGAKRRRRRSARRRSTRSST